MSSTSNSSAATGVFGAPNVGNNQKVADVLSRAANVVICPLIQAYGSLQIPIASPASDPRGMTGEDVQKFRRLSIAQKTVENVIVMAKETHNLYYKRNGQTDEEKEALKQIAIFTSNLLDNAGGKKRKIGSWRALTDLRSTLKEDMGDMIVGLPAGPERDEDLLAVNLEDHRLLLQLSHSNPKHPLNLSKEDRKRFWDKQESLRERTGLKETKRKAVDDGKPAAKKGKKSSAVSSDSAGEETSDGIATSTAGIAQLAVADTTSTAQAGTAPPQPTGPIAANTPTATINLSQHMEDMLDLEQQYDNASVADVVRRIAKQLGVTDDLERRISDASRALTE